MDAGAPDRLPPDELRALSQLSVSRALGATAIEWLGIALAAGLYLRWPGPLSYVSALFFIGARQHALTVLGRDASHYRYLPNKLGNDLVASLLLMWPVFVSVHGFRKLHGDHHRNPKSRRWLALLFVAREPLGWTIGRFACYALVAALLTRMGWWTEFLLVWIVPLCTWHLAAQCVRLIAGHSAVPSADPAFRGIRTTIPTRLEALLILPRNIGYQIEHHWYPSVPCYRLPHLHGRLLLQPRYRKHADVSTSLLRSLTRSLIPFLVQFTRQKHQ